MTDGYTPIKAPESKKNLERYYGDGRLEQLRPLRARCYPGSSSFRPGRGSGFVDVTYVVLDDIHAPLVTIKVVNLRWHLRHRFALLAAP